MSRTERRAPGGLGFALRALRYRNYRLFFGGQIVSLIGTWMTSVATSWLVYRLTGSAWMLGVVVFAGQIPAFALAAFAGTLVDRVDKHKLVIATQAAAMVQSFALAWLTLTGRITIPLLILLNAADGVINAFDMPCRQAFVVEMIEDKKDLGNAIALNSSMVNAARMIGPAVGGALIAAAGEGWCFFADGASFLAVIAALLAMRVKPRAPKPRHAGGALAELKEGWDYTVGFAPIRAIIILLALVSLLGLPYTVLVPIYAGRILGGGPHTLGLLMTATGCGALAGAAWLAQRRSVLGLDRAIPVATAAFGLGLAAFSFSRTLWLSIAILVVVGVGFMVQIAASNTIVQTIVDDDKRGRVMSFFMMAFLGAAPFGSLLMGRLADRIGAPLATRLGGLACAVCAGVFALQLPRLRRAIRPTYERMGLLPPLVAAVRDASGLTFETRD
jgi:MFS family permease